MKKFLIYAMSVMTLVACKQEKVQDQNDSINSAAQHEIDSLKAVNASQAKELEDFMEMVDQVNEGFRMIKEAEGKVDVRDGNLEGSKKEEMMESLKFIKDKMDENKEIIAQLKKKLANSNGSLSSLSKQIEALELQMETQNTRIKELEEQVASRDRVIAQQGEQINKLNDNVNDLTEQNEQKAAQVAQQDKDLNTAWFVFGTKSELKEQKILESGDVLTNGNFNKGYFTKIDIRNTKDIRLYSKSAKLLTNHPDGTYQLTKDSQGQYELHITNPTKFWAASKYLVILVK